MSNFSNIVKKLLPYVLVTLKLKKMVERRRWSLSREGRRIQRPFGLRNAVARPFFRCTTTGLLPLFVEKKEPCFSSLSIESFVIFCRSQLLSSAVARQQERTVLRCVSCKIDCSGSRCCDHCACFSCYRVTIFDFALHCIHL